MKQKWTVGILLTILVILLVALTVPEQLARLVALRFSADTDVILLDPGHGGIDGGAEGTRGICEKNINLAIALYLKEMAMTDGFQVVMTREEDKGLYPDRDRQSIRSLKTEDLKARKQMIEEIRPTVFVSIHLNNFKQDRSVRGAQTFFPNGNGDKNVLDESERLALAIQSNLVSGLSDGTNRVALGKSDVLIFKNPLVPMTIVECGFLSNREEEALLIQENYQRKLARSIYKGILEYLGRPALPPIKVIDTKG